ncbi:MAG: hypothetical protein ACM3ZE_26390 [Myxococcales bacterium]
MGNLSGRELIAEVSQSKRDWRESSNLGTTALALSISVSAANALNRKQAEVDP